jgi:hypothetical protein
MRKSSLIGFLQREMQLLFLGKVLLLLSSGIRLLTPLKATYRFTSLMIIGMNKIMCNREPPKV